MGLLVLGSSVGGDTGTYIGAVGIFGTLVLILQYMKGSTVMVVNYPVQF